MENIGIDLGSYKTVVSSSRDNGSIVFDELTKRSISTVIELSQPLRRFGNHVSGPKKKEIHLRHRDFIYMLKQEDKFYLYYFINYLKRLVKDHVKNFTFTIPYWYTLVERQNLYDLCTTAGLNVTLVTDITSVASLFTVKSDASKGVNKFVVLDFGHSKTTIGIYSKIENGNSQSLEPISIDGVKIGSKDFDNKIIDFILKKYKIVSSPLSIEKIRMHCDKIKVMLNSIDDISLSLEIGEDTISINITKEEYHELIKKDLNDIKVFLEGYVNLNQITDLPIEIVGGNSHNIFIKGIVDEVFINNFISYRLNAYESCGIGAALHGAIAKFGSRLKMCLQDLCNDSIYAKITSTEESKNNEINIKENENEINNSNEVINEIESESINKCGDEFNNNNEVDIKDKVDNSNVNNNSNQLDDNNINKRQNVIMVDGKLIKEKIIFPSNTIKISYKKKQSFFIDLLGRKNNLIKKIFVKDPEDEVDLYFTANKKGILELENEMTNVILEEHSKNNFSDVNAKEIELREREDETHKIGNMRNELESCIMNINEEKLKLNEEEKNKLNTIREEMMYEEMSKTIQEENEKREIIINKIKFIEIKTNQIANEKKNKINNYIKETEETIKEINKNNVFIRSLYKLQGMITNTKNIVESINGSIFEIDKLHEIDEEKIIREMEIVKIEARQEEKRKIEEEKRKEKIEKEKIEKEKIEKEKNEKNKVVTNDEKKEKENEEVKENKEEKESKEEKENEEIRKDEI